MGAEDEQVDVGLHIAPLPEPGLPVELVGSTGGPWTALVESSGPDAVALVPRPGAGPPPAPGEALVLTFLSRGIVWEVPVALEAPAAGVPATLIARPAGVARLSRRRAVRVAVTIDAVVTPGEAQPSARAETRNLSVDGALLATARQMEVGSGVHLLLAGHEGPLDLRGTVVRCDPQPGDDLPWQVAVAFDDLEPDCEDRLRRFLLRRDT